MDQTALPSSTSSGLLSHPSNWLPDEYKRLQNSRKLARQATEVMLMSQQKKKSKSEKAAPVTITPPDPTAAKPPPSQRPLTAGHAEHYAAFQRKPTCTKIAEKQAATEAAVKERKSPAPRPPPPPSLTGLHLKHSALLLKSTDPVANIAYQFVPEEASSQEPASGNATNQRPRAKDYWDTASDLLHSATPMSTKKIPGSSGTAMNTIFKCNSKAAHPSIRNELENQRQRISAILNAESVTKDVGADAGLN